MFQFLSLLPHADQIAFLRLFRYLTFRSGGAVLTALFVAFVMGPGLIRWLKQRQGKGQPIREDGPQRHILEKQGTPTMGGLLILLPTVVSTLFWADLTNTYVWIVLLVTTSYGLLGFADDYLKVSKRSTGGVSGKVRLVVEFGIAFLATWLMMRAEAPDLSGTLAVPFLKSALVPLGIFFILVGNVKFADYLQLHYVAGTGELTVFLASLIGAGLGFLWYNAPPAMVFMGDTGSLPLGGALGAVAVAVKHEIVLAIVGGLFVLETVSVIVQVVSFKLTGKRVFRMAPIHHHYEQLGWKEPTIVIRFWIVAVVLALIGLSTLKLR